ncbi:MAG TPA: hypothetical protein VEQ59_17085 [Polyangiaceae bacterium]|nr:hypothetical protein [Polyangiaceae bacterium]
MATTVAQPPSDAALVEAVKGLELTQLPFPGPATDGAPGAHPLGDAWGVQLLRRFTLASASYAILLFGDGRAMGIVVGKESSTAPLFRPLTGYFAEFGGLGVTETWLGDLVADDHQTALLVFQETTTTGHPDPSESARLRALLIAPAGARELTLPTTLPERATVQARSGGSSVVETCRTGRAQVYRFDFATSALVKQGTEPCSH